jgi:hypothetical protein
MNAANLAELDTAFADGHRRLVEPLWVLPSSNVVMPVNGTLNLTPACRYRHFESDPSASSLFPRSREQCGQMLSSLSFALLGRAMMPARRLSLSR